MKEGKRRERGERWRGREAIGREGGGSAGGRKRRRGRREDPKHITPTVKEGTSGSLSDCPLGNLPLSSSLIF